MAKNRLTPRAAEQLLAAQNLVLEMIASGAPLDAILRSLASFIDQYEPDGMCAIYVLEPDGLHFKLGATSKVPQAFLQAVRGVTVGPKSGSGGTAAYRRERVIVADLATDPLFENFRQIALAFGLRACWSTPIESSDRRMLGVACVYYKEVRVPAERTIAAVERATYLARIAIERRHTEAQLQASEERFRSLIEHTSDVISILEADGIIRYQSPSTERVLGLRPGEMVGAAVFDFFHPDDVERVRRSFQQVLKRSGLCSALEQRFRHGDGSWRMLETIANNQLDDPAIGGIIVTARDVTDRRRTEEQLISSQERYRELFENANDVVFTTDLGWTLTSINKAGEALTGYPRDQALGMNVASFLSPDYVPLAREMLDRKIGGEAKTTYEVEILRKDGRRIPVELSTRLIFKMGQPVAVQGIGRDVTERRRYDSHMLQSQKMEAIGRLAGGVAHDFNNLLTVITGYSQWMLDELPPESAVRDSASEILLAANRAAALTNQLLAFSRNQVIQPIIVDLNSLVGQLDQMLRRIIGEDIELITVTHLDLHLVRADPGQIEQVILNLVVNARDAMPNGGKLIIETANINIGEEDARAQLDCVPGAYAVLAVSDTGCGIGENIQPHIFEPFFTTKEQGKGTGLGLSTVYGVVKQCGGHIRVDSKPGVGSVFRVYFPRVADGPARDVIPEKLRRTRGTETILLVEDETAVRQIVGGMLMRLGYTVMEAPDARSALKFAAEYQNPIHLLLTDIVMPEMGGRELAQSLKKVHGDLKVLFMSGYADDALAREGVLEPPFAYLRKPFTPNALASKIRDLLDGG